MLVLKNLTATCIYSHFFSGFPSITATSLFEPRPCLRKQEVFPDLAGSVSWTLSSTSLWGSCHCWLFMLLLASLFVPVPSAKTNQASLAESNHFFQNHLCVSSSCIPALMIFWELISGHSQCQVQQVIWGTLYCKPFTRCSWYTSGMHFPGWEWPCLQTWPGQQCRLQTWNEEWLKLEKYSFVSTVQQYLP